MQFPCWGSSKQQAFNSLAATGVSRRSSGPLNFSLIFELHLVLFVFSTIYVNRLLPFFIEFSRSIQRQRMAGRFLNDRSPDNLREDLTRENAKAWDKQNIKWKTKTKFDISMLKCIKTNPTLPQLRNPSRKTPDNSLSPFASSLEVEFRWIWSRKGRKDTKL